MKKSINIGGYEYFASEKEAAKNVKTSDDVLAYEGGLGWYIHSKKEYKTTQGKKSLGSEEEKQ